MDFMAPSVTADLLYILWPFRCLVSHDVSTHASGILQKAKSLCLKPPPLPPLSLTDECSETARSFEVTHKSDLSDSQCKNLYELKETLFIQFICIYTHIIYRHIYVCVYIVYCTYIHGCDACLWVDIYMCAGINTHLHMHALTMLERVKCFVLLFIVKSVTINEQSDK